MGFNFEKGTALINRNLSFKDLQICMEHIKDQRKADHVELRKDILEGNILGKATLVNRKDIAEKLRIFYSFDTSMPVFRFFKSLWYRNVDAQPLLAFQLAQARDKFLYNLHEILESFSESEHVQTKNVLEKISSKWKAQYSEQSLFAMAKHLVSAWSEAGFLSKGKKKFKISNHVLPENVCFALYLCNLQHISGENIFESKWIKSFYLDRSSVINLGLMANQKGLCEFQIASNLIRIKFNDEVSAG
ncbi:hypothetical protein [Leptospira levettii]|uniref:hypothetical protein n=1 Tax=Leptospira levettii TaxID=2023178 RepID=UPI003EC0AA3E